MGKILVTGGNGFVATHIVHQLLEKGHEVVTTIRTPERQKETASCIPEAHSSKISYAIVKDGGAPNAYDEVIKGHKLDGIIHTATPFHFNFEDPHDIYDPAVIGTESVLEAAHKYAPTVTRVVILSSCSSVLHEEKGTWPGHTYTEADWNPITKEQSLDGNKSHGYYGAKTWAEKAVWEFVKTKNPKFTIAALCPPYVFGPVANKVTSVKELGTSNAVLYSVVDGSQKGKEIQPNGVWMFADVRDLAQALIAAYEKPEAANQRFIITNGIYCNKQLSDIFSKHFPDRAENIATKLSESLNPDGFPKDGVYSVDNSKSIKYLGIKYHTLEETVVDFMASIKAIEGK